jgi:hypothetical protein
VVLERPDVDKIDGLSPVIAIRQKTTSKSHDLPLALSVQKFMTFFDCCSLVQVMPTVTIREKNGSYSMINQETS